MNLDDYPSNRSSQRQYYRESDCCIYSTTWHLAIMLTGEINKGIKELLG